MTDLTVAQMAVGNSGSGGEIRIHKLGMALLARGEAKLTATALIEGMFSQYLKRLRIPTVPLKAYESDDAKALEAFNYDRTEFGMKAKPAKHIKIYGSLAAPGVVLGIPATLPQHSGH